MCDNKKRNEVRFSDMAGDEYDVTPAMVDAARDAFALSAYRWSECDEDWPDCARAIFVAMFEAKKK